MAVDPLSLRTDRESEHFDRVYAEEEKSGNLLLTDADKRRYLNPSPVGIYSKEYFYHLLGPLRGKKVLDIACGGGVDTALAAHYGADVYAYDVSPVAVGLTRKRAEVNGLAERVQLQVCGDLEQAFPGEQFDAIMGFAALHHLPLDGLGERLHDRLKAGGVAVFAEPVVNSKFLSSVRKRIPYRPVEITEDEQPLNDQAIAKLAKPFARIRRREFECVARVYPLFSHRPRLVRAVWWLDSWLMKVKPLRRFASVVVFALDRDA